jgi:hypothetical protein
MLDCDGQKLSSKGGEESVFFYIIGREQDKPWGKEMI